MKDILLLGGMGSGKTTLADFLTHEKPSINYIYISKYVVGIPMTLIANTSQTLLSLPKSEYIDTIFKNQGIELINFSREEMNKFSQMIMDLYGDTVAAELAIRATKQGLQNLIDNIIKVSNVKYLKDKGFFIVNLHCRFETQVQRRLKNRKDIDPSEGSLLEQQVERTNAFF